MKKNNDFSAKRVLPHIIYMYIKIPNIPMLYYGKFYNYNEKHYITTLVNNSKLPLYEVVHLP